MSDASKILIETVEKIIFSVGVVASVDVTLDVVDEDTYHVNLSGDDLGVVIGYHGEGLASLQTVLSLILAKKLGKFTHIIVDVNGYRKEREEKIKEMVKSSVDRVKFSLKDVELPPMVAFERRLVHMEVSKSDGVYSESIGDGYNRRVVVKPKKE